MGGGSQGRISDFYKSTVGAEHRAARKSDAQGTAPLHRPRTDIRPPFGTLNDNSTAIQPLLNSAPTVGNFNPSTTVLQPPHQPSFNRLPTTTHTLIARASSHLPRQARTSSSLPHRSKTPCNHAQTRKRRAGRSPPAHVPARRAVCGVCPRRRYATTRVNGTRSVSESTSGSTFVRLKLSSAAYSPGSSGAWSSVTFATPPASSPNVAG